MPRNDLIIKIGADDGPLKEALKKLNNSLASFGAKMEGIGKQLSLRFTAPVVAAGVASIKTFAQFDKLEKGLTAITGSLPEAQKQFGNLLDVVKDTRTTLDLKTAATASLQLQAVGRDARSVENTLKQLGIAATLAGSSSDDVGEVGRQLSQAAAKGKILQQELRIILERIPSLAKIVKDEFGTVTADGLREAGVGADEFIDRLTKAIETNEKFQSVQGGISKAIETFGINLQIAGAELGKTISETIGLENILTTVSNTIGRLVEAFSNLSSGTKSVILGIAGAAAAFGPLLLGTGAALKVLPLVIKGFSVLTGPVGLAATALAGLATILLVFKDNANDATKAFNEQKTAVNTLDTELAPLVNRYEELKGKSNKSAEEQEELKKVISQIGGIVPSAITQFGKYGEALDISTDKVNDFVAAQKLLLQQKNREAIDANTVSLENYRKELENINKQLNATDNKGDALPQKQVNFATTGGIQSVSLELSDDEIRNLQTRAAQLRVEINNTQNAVKILKGEFETGSSQPKIIEPEDSETVKEFTQATDEQTKALQKVKEEIALTEKRFALFGKTYQFIQEKTDAVSGGLDTLLKAGFNPTSVAVQDLVSELGALQAQYETVNSLETLDFIPQSVSTNLKKAKEDFSEFALVVDGASDPLTKYGQALEKLNEKNQIFGGSFDLIGEQVKLVEQTLNQAIENGYGPTFSSIEALIELLKKLNKQREEEIELEKTKAAISSVAASAFESAASSQVQSFQEIARAATAAAAKIIKAQLAEATAKFISKSFTSLGPIGGAIAAAAAGSVIGGLFSSALSKLNIPALAEGALVTGPTLALIGEGRENEVVLPLSKLNGMLNNAGGREELVARVEGESIYFMLKRIEQTLNRVG